MSYGFRPLLENSARVYVGTYIRHILSQSNTPLKATTIDEANLIVERIRNSSITMTVGEKTEYMTPSLVYLPSNLGLGRGYIFYFLCKGCGRRARYLYSTNYKITPLCRSCQHLVYKKQRESNKTITKYLNHPELISRMADSPRLKDQLHATQAYFMIDILKERARERVEKEVLSTL